MNKPLVVAQMTDVRAAINDLKRGLDQLGTMVGLSNSGVDLNRIALSGPQRTAIGAIEKFAWINWCGTSRGIIVMHEGWFGHMLTVLRSRPDLAVVAIPTDRDEPDADIRYAYNGKLAMTIRRRLADQIMFDHYKLHVRHYDVRVFAEEEMA